MLYLLLMLRQSLLSYLVYTLTGEKVFIYMYNHIPSRTNYWILAIVENTRLDLMVPNQSKLSGFIIMNES